MAENASLMRNRVGVPGKTVQAGWAQHRARVDHLVRFRTQPLRVAHSDVRLLHEYAAMVILLVRRPKSMDHSIQN